MLNIMVRFKKEGFTYNFGRFKKSGFTQISKDGLRGSIEDYSVIVFGRAEHSDIPHLEEMPGVVAIQIDNN